MRSVGLTLVLSCAVAFAQPKNKSTELFEQGRALAAQGKWTEACAKFDESYTLDRAPGTALNYGDCLENLGQLRRAWQLFDGAANDFTRDNDGRATYARERADKVGVKLAAITVKVANPAQEGLVIKIGDQVVASKAQIDDRFEPGEIVVTATAPGKQDFSSRANGLAGSSVIVEIPAELGAGNGGAVGPFIDAPPGPGPRDQKRVRIALITGGVGAASFVTSVILGISAKAKYTDGLEACPRNEQGQPVCTRNEDKQVLDDAGSRANIATGFAIAGGALLVAGAVIYFTAPRESLHVTPLATGSSVGLSLSGAF
jgi:tetratricopeptide (TPR) repeat protein